MDWLKDMENIFGMMGVFIEEILSKGIEMDMGCGNLRMEKKCIKGITCWIESMDMESMSGKQEKFIKEHI